MRVLGLNTLVYFVFGVGAWAAALFATLGVLGHAPLALTVPWLVVVPFCLLAARFVTAPSRVAHLTRSTGSLLRRGLAYAIAGTAWVREVRSAEGGRRALGASGRRSLPSRRSSCSPPPSEGSSRLPPRNIGRVRRVLVLFAVVGLATASPLVASSVRMKLTTTTPTPRVGEPWRYTLTVRSTSGAPLLARTKLQLLLGDTVVGCWKGGAMVQCFGKTAGDWITLRGKRSGLLQFPAQSVGVRLTFQATVKVQRLTRKVRAPVTVQPMAAPSP